MFTITDVRKIQIFDVFQLNSISLHVSEFLKVNCTWYNLKKVSVIFSKVFEIFIIQEKPAYRNQVLFNFQNISITSNFYRGHSCLTYTKYYLDSEIEANTNIYLT